MTRQHWLRTIPTCISHKRTARQRFHQRCRPQLENLESRLTPDGSFFSVYNFGPVNIWQAYGITPVLAANYAGQGETIAIIDPYDNPNIKGDLQAFDKAYGLNDPPSFTVVDQNGGSQLPSTDPAGGGSAREEALDVEWAHAIAPGANIVLVECYTAYGDLETGAEWAGSQGYAVVSMSFGADGGTGVYGDIFSPATYPGVTFVASTGDHGSVYGSGGFPADSPNVLAVGGTSLAGDVFSTYFSGYSGESAWGSTGGGISNFYSQPVYQQQLANRPSTTKRMTPDVSFDADPTKGVQIYDSYNGQSSIGWNWYVEGGTSLSAPCWAGLIAIADQIRGQFYHMPPLTGASQTLPRLYGLANDPTSYANDFHDVTSGGNGTYNAGTGYDLVTGLGSPVANKLLPDLAAPAFNMQQPANVAADAGLTAVFQTHADHDPSVQWQVNTGSGFTDIPGATSTTLSVANVSSSSDGYLYRARFTDKFGYTDVTSAARLSVDYVTANPSDQTITFGQSATFTAASFNPSGTDTVQWQVDPGPGFTNIVGATSTTLTLSNPTVAQNGVHYRAMFTNSAGSFYSTSAELNVSPAPLTVVSMQVNDGSPQRSMVTSLTVTFSRPISALLGAFEIDSGTTRLIPTDVTISGNQAIIRFTGLSGVEAGSLADGRYTLVERKGAIYSDGRNYLLLANHSDAFFRLYGDVNGDGKVDLSDRTAFLAAYRSRKGMTSYQWYFDYNNDGMLDSTDYYQFQQRYGTQLTP
jgi:subtilase family serine protease